jgi:branched-subunit amino acid aminotransferase/4-amino-4-deoxychorismate lyase
MGPVYGIFETVRVESGRAVLAPYHYRRMRGSAKLLGLPFELSYREFKERVEAEALYPVSLVRLSLTEEGLSFSCRPCKKRDSVALLPFYSVRRVPSLLSRHKLLDATPSFFALRRANRAGFDEALLFSPEGYLSETAFANLFFLKRGVLYTPSLDCGPLKGTRREFILELCRELKLPVVEGKFRLKELLSADEAFITSAREDACPITKVGRFKMREPAGKPFWKRVREAIEWREKQGEALLP